VARQNGQGSVYRRKSDGKWAAAISIDGKRVVRYSATEREAKAMLRQLQHDREHNRTTLPTDVTLSEWVTRWLTTCELDLRPSTCRTYREVLQFVCDVIGSVRLHKLTNRKLTDAFAQLQRQGRGKRRLNLAHTYLRKCLQDAVDHELLGTNPMDRVKKPRWKPKERTYWTLPQSKNFVETALTSELKWSPLFAFMVTTGLRISEALALTWNDIDLEAATVRVSKALIWDRTHYVDGAPKTSSGYRSISLPGPAVKALKMLPRGSVHSRIFVTCQRTSPTPNTLKQALQRLCSNAEVPFVNVHGLRHVAAMLALQATGDAYVVQRRLGHSHVSITLGIYGYSPSSDSETANKLDGLLGAS
jgi:integrase